jgi:glutamate:GABA antiporter
MNKESRNRITITSIIMMNILGILGLRWFAFAGKYGAASVLIWIVAAFLFFIPSTFICAEFGAAYPDKEGAITDWVKAELGEKAAFMASWFYFITQLFYLPTLLTFTGVCIGYAIDPKLASNKLFITSFVIIIFWVMLFLSTKSLEVFKKTSEINCFLGTILPIILLILAAVVSVFLLKNKIPTNFSPSNWVPKFNLDNLLFLVGVGTALAGAELSAPFVSKMKNPQKNFPIAILMATVLIILGYIVGTLAIVLVVSPDNFTTSNGIFEVLLIVFSQIKMKFLAILVFILIAFGNLGGMMIWLVSPTKMLIDGNDPKIFPKIFIKKTADGLPVNAMIFQGIFITCIVVLGNLLSTVDKIYDTLVMASSVLLFVTYVMLLIAYIKMKFTKKRKLIFEMPGGKIGAVIAFILALSICLAAIIIPIISAPASGTLIYELEVIGIPILLGIIGYIFYTRRTQ